MENLIKLFRKNRKKSFGNPGFASKAKKDILDNPMFLVEEAIEDSVALSIEDKMRINRNTGLSRLRNDPTVLLDLRNYVQEPYRWKKK